MATFEAEPLLHSEGADHVEESKYLKLSTVIGWVAQYRVYVCIFLLKFCMTFYIYIFELPLVRLVERAICQTYYKSLPSNPDWQDVDEAMCKLPVIQDKLAYIMGFRLTFNAIPGLLTSVAYGFLADKYGRRPILALACTGESLALLWILFVCYWNTAMRIELVWVEGLFYFIGGGSRLVYAMIFTMVADVVPSPKRSQTLFFLHAVAHFCRLPALLLSSVFMDTHLWLPFVLAFFFLFANFMILWAIPETAPGKSAPSLCSLDANAEVIAAEPEELDGLIARPSSSADDSVSTHKRPNLQRVSTMLRHTGVFIILATFMTKRIAFSSASESFIYQYASERFHMRLSQTFPVRVTHIAGALLVTLLILPLVSHYWRSRDAYPPLRDLWISRATMTVAVFGFLIIWTALRYDVLCIGMFLCGLAEGLEPALQGLGSFIVGRFLNASFFTFITMLDTIAALFGGPVMAGLLSIRNPDGGSAGYCFLLSAILFALLWLSSWKIDTSPISSRSFTSMPHSR